MSKYRTAMDRNITVRTPESIAFSYELAGVGSRFLAVALDLIIQILIVVLLFLGFAFAASHYHPTPHQMVTNYPLQKFATSMFIGIVIFVNFMIFFGYFILFEAFGHGQTPGKRMMGIRVVRDGGFPLEFWGALVRNVVRIGELAMAFYAVSAITAILSRENKRIGDYAAGTIVVRDSSYALPKLFVPADPTNNIAREA
ncbi:MAG: RDD family protein [Vulcanimicrobiaceae bacterium]